MDPREFKKMKRSLFAGKPEPVERMPPMKRKCPDLQLGVAGQRALPPGTNEQPITLERRAASTETSVGEKLKTESPVGVVPVTVPWMNVPVPLKWHPALVLQVDMRDSTAVLVPVPHYAINPPIL